MQSSCGHWTFKRAFSKQGFDQEGWPASKTKRDQNKTEDTVPYNA